MTQKTQSKQAYFTLKDDKNKIDLKIEQVSGFDIGIRFKGYGEYAAKDGEGAPVLLTLEDGNLQVAVWSDINQEDATHIISMDKAKESHRDVNDDPEPVKQAVKFTKEEQIIIHEVARYGLAMVFTEIAEELDLSDEVLHNLQEKLTKEGNNG